MPGGFSLIWTNPKKVFFKDPPVLITMAPLISQFQGSQHNYWYPEAAAYKSRGNYGVYTLSRTYWGAGHEDQDVTLAQTFNLDGN